MLFDILRKLAQKEILRKSRRKNPFYSKVIFSFFFLYLGFSFVLSLAYGKSIRNIIRIIVTKNIGIPTFFLQSKMRSANSIFRFKMLNIRCGVANDITCNRVWSK